MNTIHTLYEVDFYAWLHKNIEYLQNKQIEKIDKENILKELEDMASYLRHTLENQLKILCVDVLKFEFITPHDSVLKQNIYDQQLNLKKLLEKNPSLENIAKQMFITCYRYAFHSLQNDFPERAFVQDEACSLKKILNWI